jgi:hypothetical protein
MISAAIVGSGQPVSPIMRLRAHHQRPARISRAAEEGRKVRFGVISTHIHSLCPERPMANSHNFANSKDSIVAGAWSDDNGEPICSWSWDPVTGKLTVTCGTHGKRKTLPSEMAQLNPEQLRKRLPRLALSLAEQINVIKYEH